MHFELNVPFWVCPTYYIQESETAGTHAKIDEGSQKKNLQTRKVIHNQCVIIFLSLIQTFEKQNNEDFIQIQRPEISHATFS